MDPTEFDQRIRPLLAPKNGHHRDTSTPLKPRPRPCEYCTAVVDQQVIQIYRKWLANEPYTYKKCSICFNYIEKKLIATK